MECHGVALNHLYCEQKSVMLHVAALLLLLQENILSVETLVDEANL